MDDLFFVDLQTGIRHMVARSGLSYAQVSRAIGRNDRYMSIMLNEGTTPRIDLLVSIARTCGYSIELHGHGEVFVLMDREALGAQADEYPNARTFVLSHINDESLELAPAPERRSGGRHESPRRVDFANVQPETEEEFAKRDPKGYAEYRHEMEALANEALDLEDRLTRLKKQFFSEVEGSLGERD